MKEKPHTCRNCNYYQELPFAEHQMYCMNPDSEYAECECSDYDTCDSWKDVDDE